MTPTAWIAFHCANTHASLEGGLLQKKKKKILNIKMSHAEFFNILYSFEEDSQDSSIKTLINGHLLWII